MTDRPFESLDDDEPWDADLAADLIGSTLLVGLTYLSPDGEAEAYRQFFGVVLFCDPERGLGVRCAGQDEPEVIAPVLDAIEAADPGVYRLKETGEEIVDPDFIALLTVRRPAKS